MLTNAVRTLLRPALPLDSPLSSTPATAPECAFCVRTVPRAPLHAFIERVVEYMRADNETFICAVYYLLLLCGAPTPALHAAAAQRTPRLHSIALTLHNAHRFVFAAVLVAAKWRAEAPMSMEYFALVCGVAKQELLAMEWAMLQLLDFNAHVSAAAFHLTAAYVVGCTIRPSQVALPSGRCGAEAWSVEDACAAVKRLATSNSHGGTAAPAPATQPRSRCDGWSPALISAPLQLVKGLLHSLSFNNDAAPSGKLTSSGSFVSPFAAAAASVLQNMTMD